MPIPRAYEKLHDHHIIIRRPGADPIAVKALKRDKGIATMDQRVSIYTGDTIDFYGPNWQHGKRYTVSKVTTGRPPKGLPNFYRLEVTDEQPIPEDHPETSLPQEIDNEKPADDDGSSKE